MKEQVGSINVRARRREKRNLWGIILAGGEGKRLQGFINKIYGSSRPKQYCNITGSKSLIRNTRDRALSIIPQNRLITILNKTDYDFAMEEIGDQPPETFVIQPANRETTAGILLPLLKIYISDKNAVVSTFPSDHFIHEEIRFMKYVKEAYEFVRSNPDSIVLLGVKPQKYEPGYGWIEKHKLTQKNPDSRIHKVKGFREKPTYETALELMSKGALWNTFVLVGSAKTLINNIKLFAGEVYEPFETILRSLGTPHENEVINETYRIVPRLNFSSAVLEKIKDNLFVLEVPDVYWSDWGEEKRIYYDAEKFGSSLFDQNIYWRMKENLFPGIAGI